MTYALDFSRPIVGYGNFSKEFNDSFACAIDQRMVEGKFALWDDAISGGNLKDRGEGESGSGWALLKDKTIFAYAMFRYEGKPMKMRWYQDAVLSDTHDRILWASSNQIGKSLTLDVDAAVSFMTDHGKGWVGILISKSLEQSQYQMFRIKQLLKSAKVTYREEETEETKTGKRDTTTKVSYTFYDTPKPNSDSLVGDGKPQYSNLLICCPPSGSALGYPADDLWLDEFDYWENVDCRWFIYNVAIPRTYHTKGRIKIFSCPDGREKMMWELWNTKDADGKNTWHRYNFNYWDTPGACQEDFDKKCTGMPRAQVESTLLALFTSSEGAYFSYEEIEGSYDRECGILSMAGKQPFFFLDVGAKHDQSVLVGGWCEPDVANPSLLHVHVPILHAYPVNYPLSRVVGSKVSDDDGWHYEPSVKDFILEWSEGGVNPVFGVDVTGNSGITPLLESVGIHPVDVTFSGPVKSGMYQRFKYLMEKKLLHRPRNNLWERQAASLVMRKSERGYLMIHHATEDDLDDCMDATAGLVHLMDPHIGVYVTPTLTMLNEGDENA